MSKLAVIVCLLVPSWAVDYLTSLMWNPQRDCFTRAPDCAANVTDSLTHLLASGNLDFANVVMLKDGSYEPPDGWRRIVSTCGLNSQMDTTNLFYNNKSWKKVSADDSGAIGCMVDSPFADRSYVVQLFDHMQEDFSLIVVAAHYPAGHHLFEGSQVLGKAIRSICGSSGVDNVLLVADVNGGRSSSSRAILEALGLRNAHSSSSTKRMPTCCFSHGINDGFRHEDDRIIANFGYSMATHVLFEEPGTDLTVPLWASEGFHKGIIGSLQTRSGPLTLKVWRIIVIGVLICVVLLFIGMMMYCCSSASDQTRPLMSSEESGGRSEESGGSDDSPEETTWMLK